MHVHLLFIPHFSLIPFPAFIFPRSWTPPPPVFVHLPMTFISSSQTHPHPRSLTLFSDIISPFGPAFWGTSEDGSRLWLADWVTAALPRWHTDAHSGLASRGTETALGLKQRPTVDKKTRTSHRDACGIILLSMSAGWLHHDFSWWLLGLLWCRGLLIGCSLSRFVC